MGKASELDDLITAHNEYAKKREEFESYIEKAFEDNDMQIQLVTFTKTGFEVECGTGHYILNNFNKLIEAFPDYELSFDFKDFQVLFKFIKNL